MTNLSVAVVVTSISSPTACMRLLAEGARARALPFYCIGDVPSPPEYSLDGCEFLSIAAQRGLPFQYAVSCPERHYARKNIGYLKAMADGAELILETDDDNYPAEGFWEMGECTDILQVEGVGWYNVYKWFGADAWPRGFPLENVLSDNTSFAVIDSLTVRPLVWQGMVSGEPDVDAIYRLTRKSPVEFKRNSPLVMGRGVWSPFNSQNTQWKKTAFPLLYLPATCSFRATDIIRGYVAIRCLWELDAGVAFLPPTAVQDRNVHDLMRDFSEEIEIYMGARRIREVLERVALKVGPVAINDNLIRCYEALALMKVVKNKELRLVEAWCDDIGTISIP